MYVCIYVCTYIHIYTNIHIYTYIHIYIHNQRVARPNGSTLMSEASCFGRPPTLQGRGPHDNAADSAGESFPHAPDRGFTWLRRKIWQEDRRFHVGSYEQPAPPPPPKK